MLITAQQEEDVTNSEAITYAKMEFNIFKKQSERLRELLEIHFSLHFFIIGPPCG